MVTPPWIRWPRPRASTRPSWVRHYDVATHVKAIPARSCRDIIAFSVSTRLSGDVKVTVARAYEQFHSQGMYMAE